MRPFPLLELQLLVLTVLPALLRVSEEKLLQNFLALPGGSKLASKGRLVEDFMLWHSLRL